MCAYLYLGILRRQKYTKKVKCATFSRKCCRNCLLLYLNSKVSEVKMEVKGSEFATLMEVKKDDTTRQKDRNKRLSPMSEANELPRTKRVNSLHNFHSNLHINKWSTDSTS